MAIIQNWMPPSKENYELIVFLFQFFPLVRLTSRYSHTQDGTILISNTGNNLPMGPAMVWGWEDFD